MVLAIFDVPPRWRGRDRASDAGGCRRMGDASIADHADVVCCQVIVVGVVPRVKFNPERRLKAAESKVAARGACGVRSHILQHEDDAVGTGCVVAAKIHQRLQMKRRLKVQDLVGPYRAYLGGGIGSELKAVVSQVHGRTSEVVGAELGQ